MLSAGSLVAGDSQIRSEKGHCNGTMASSFFIDPSFTGYGKSGVRLLKIKRSGKYHEIKQVEVATELKLDNYRDYNYGNNSSVVPTDTQKNTVYALAKDHPVSIISFYFILCAAFAS